MDKHASLNKLFRLVWSAAHQCWVAVAEHTTGRGKSGGGRRQRAALLAAIGATSLSAFAQTAPPPLAPNTLPTNGQVTAGSATVSSGGSTMTIDQSTQRAVIQWDTFNVGSNAQVNFRQPSPSSATLNRVLDNNASQIAGRITANGQVVISNPNGVLFTPGASVDVGSLTATTHTIGTADFMAGLATYQRNGSTGAVVNQGQLRAALGGYIALLAPEVRNEGVLIAQAGTVALAAGEAIRLDFGSNGKLIAITATPSEVRALVENKQAVYAPGGLIVLSARAVNTLQGALVRNSGTLSASSLVSDGGRIVLAGDEVHLSAGSRTEATGAVRGGQVEVQAHTVTIAGSVDVSGAQGGRFDIQATGPVQISGTLTAQGTAGAGGSVVAQTTNTSSTAGLVVGNRAQLIVTGSTDGGSVQLQAHGIELSSATVDASGDAGAGGQVALTSTSHVTVTDSRVHADGAQAGGRITVAASHEPLPAPNTPTAPTHHIALLGSTSLGSSSRRGRGGDITLTGGDLLLDGSTTLDATGATGGGTVRVGGDWQGGNGLPQATTVTMGAGTTIEASATGQGDGGTIVLWSDVHDATSLTTASGTLRARGGEQGGNGGKIETSGHTVALEDLSVNAGAATGMGSTGGLWYIDPADATITQTIANGYAATLNTGTSVLNDVSGSITWNSGVTLSKTTGGDATLTLRAGGNANDRNIDLNNAQISTSGSGALNLVIWTRYNSPAYSGRVSMNGASISTNGGHVFIGGGNATTWNGLSVGDGSAATWTTDQRGVYLRDTTITTSGGSVLMRGTSHDTGSTAGTTNFGIQVDAGSSITTGAGSISLTGAVLGRFSNGAGLVVGSLGNTGDVSLTSTTGAITLEGTGTDQNGSNGNGWRHAMLLIGSGTSNDVTVRSTSGTITLDGRATFSSGNGVTDSSGVQLQAGSAGSHVDVVSTSGAINVVAENSLEASQYTDALRITAPDAAGAVRIGYDGTTTYSGNINIGANSILQRTNNAGAGSISIQSTGTLTIAPRGSAFTALRADSAGTLTFDNDWNFGTALTGFTLGSSTNTRALTLSNALSVAGPISITGGDIAINAALTSSGTGDIRIISNSTGDSSLAISGSGSINKTGGGRNLLLLRGNGRVRNSGAITASGTGVLDTVLWSDYTNSNTGGVSIAANVTTNGGHLWAGGSATNGGSTTWNGLTVGDGGSVGNVNANHNAMDANGAISTGGGDVMLWAGTGHAIQGIGVTGTSSINAGSGKVTLIADTITDGGSGTTKLTVTTTGVLTLAPDGGAYGGTLTWGGSFAGANYSGSNAYNSLVVNSLASVTGLTVGSYTGTGLAGDTAYTFSNSSDLSIDTAIAVAGPLALSGGSIGLNANLSTTAAGAALLVKGNGNILANPSRTFQSNNGNLTFWADADGNSNGWIGIQSGTVLNSANGSTSQTTGGGRITLAGGTATDANGLPTGYAYAASGTGAWGSNVPSGVQIGAYSYNHGGGSYANDNKFYSGGGDIVIRGRAADGSPGISWYGGASGTQVVDAGAGTIRLDGQGMAAGHGIELYYFGGNTSPTLRSSSNSTTAIDIDGTTTGTGTVAGYQGAATLIASGTGGIAVDASTASTNWYSVQGPALNLYAASGDIAVTGTGGTGFNLGGTWGRGTLASSSSDITLTANAITFNTATINSSGDLTIQPLGTSFTSAVTLPNTLTFGTTLSSLTVGKTTSTANLTFNGAASVAGPVNAYGGTLAINAALTSTAANQGILARGTGAITAGANLTTNGGDITLWANSAGATAGGIQVSNNVTLSSSGGAITLGGSAGTIAGAPATSANGTTLPQGYAQNYGSTMSGLLLGTDVGANGQNSTVAINSGNGRISLAGHSSQYVSSLSIGLLTYEGINVNAGTGDISLYGLSTGAVGGNANIGFTLAGFFGTATSPSKWQTNGGNIVMNGSSTGATATGIGADPQGGTNGTTVTIENTSASSGSVTINGTASNSTTNVGLRTWNTNILSRSGAITLNALGASGSSWNVSSSYTTTLGYLAATDVTSATGNIAVTADALNLAGTLNVNNTGTLAVQSNGSTFTSAVTTTNMSVASGSTGVTIGKTTNSADVTIANAIGIAGPIAIHGGNLALNANLSSSASGSAVLARASGNITGSASRTFQTNNGNLTLWSDSDGSGGGNITLGDSTTLNSANGSTSQNTGGGRITLAGGSTVDANGLPTGFANTSGAAHGISLGTSAGGVAIHSGGGDILVNGRTTTTSNADVFHGLNAFGSLTVRAGDGAITMAGESTDSYGTEFSRGGNSGNTTAITSSKGTGTAISISGTSTASSSGHGLVFDNPSIENIYATGGGAINLTGSGSGGGYGVWLQGSNVLASAGAINIDGGTAGVRSTGNASRIGQSNAGVTSSSSAITLTGNTLVFDTAATTIDTTGTVLLQSTGTSFSSAQTLPASLLLWGSGISGLTVGKTTNTADVTLGGAIGIAGPVSVYGGNIAVNANVSSTASGAAVLFKGTGNIVQATSVGVTTNGGNATYWADSDNSGAGYIEVGASTSIDTRTAAARAATQTTTATGGGRIVLAGGLDNNSDDVPDGYATANVNNHAGIQLGAVAANTTGTTLTSGGGDMVIRARSTGALGTNQAGRGLTMAFQNTLNAGTGTITLEGTGTNAHGIEIATAGSPSAGNAWNLITAGGGNASTAAINITGSTSGPGYSGVQVGFDNSSTTRKTLFQAVGTGGISITASKMTANAAGFLSASGPIDVTVTTGNALDLNAVTGGGQLTSSFFGYCAVSDCADSVITSSSANVTLSADTVTISNSGSYPVRVNTTGAFTLRPTGNDFSGAQTINSTYWGFGSTLSGLTIGKATSADGTSDVDVTLGSAYSVAGPISVYGRNLAVNANLGSTASGATLLLKGSGNLTVDASTSLTTNGGAITLWSDSDASGAGGILIRNGVTIDSRTSADRTGTTHTTGGGAITLGGGLDDGGTASGASTYVSGLSANDGRPDGYAVNYGNASLQYGILLGTELIGSGQNANIRMYSGSGDIRLQGQATTQNGANGPSGVMAYQGLGMNAGTNGNLTLLGVAAISSGTSSNAVDLQAWRSSSGAASTLQTVNGNIHLVGIGSGGSASNAGLNVQANDATRAMNIVATGSGNVTLEGSASGTGPVGMALSGVSALSGSDAVNVVSRSGPLYFNNFPNTSTVYLGAQSGSLVTSSSANITLSADSIVFNTPVSAVTTGTMTVQPYGNSFTSALTWPMSGLTLGGSISGLTLGKATNTADITIASATSVAGPIAVYGGNLAIDAALTATSSNTITLQGSGNVTDGTSGYVSAANLRLLGGNVTLDSSSNAIGTLAASGVGSLTYVDSNALTLGTVGGTSGISATGAVNIATLTGNLSLTQNVATTSTSSSAIQLNAGRNAAAGTTTGGDLTAANGVTVTTGTGGGARLYSSSIAASTGLIDLAGVGSGRFRYGSDESTTNYSLALPTGIAVIYREAPTVTVSAVSESQAYGATPTLAMQLDLATGDTAAQAFSSGPSMAVGGSTSTSGHYTVGTHSMTPSGGTQRLGYGSVLYTGGTLTVTPRVLNVSFSGVDKTYDAGTSATVGTSDDRVSGDAVTIARSAAFTSADAANGITVNVSGVSLSGADASNYSVGTTGSTIANITPYVVNLSGSRTYDGTTTAAAGMLNLGTLVGSQTLVLSGSGTFTNGNVGTGKSVGLGTLALGNGTNGGLASNYTLVGGTRTANIGAAAITLSTGDVTKAYDGGTTASGTAVVTSGQLFGSDSLTGGSFSFTNKNAGSGKTVNVSGVTVNDGNAGGNYTVSYAANTNSTINAAAITVSSSDVSRSYDGTTTANGSAVITSGQLFGSDSLSGGSFSFTNRNAGSNKTVNVSGVTVNDGFSGGNYSVTYAANTSSTISAAAITLSSSDVSKTYDGGTSANGSAVVTSGQLFGSDSLSGGSFSFANRNAGSGKTVNVSGVTVSDGNSGGNYSVTYAANTNSSIAAAAITLSTSDVSKGYDGTTSASGTAVVTAGQLFGSDSLSGGSFAFVDKHAGSGKTVNVSGVTVNDGFSGGNYSVSYAANTSSAISAAAITLSTSDVSKTYDGSTSANGTAVVTSGQLFGSDSLSGGNFAFANRNAGSNKTVSVSGVTVNDGHSGGNYVVSYADNTSSTINAAAITVSTSDVSRSYDGTTAANGSAVVTSGQLFGSDSLSGGNFAFTNRNAGSGKTVNVSGVTVNDGNSGGNYDVTYAANTSSAISAASITVSSSDVARSYDGTTTANGSAVVTSGQLFGSDSLSGGSFAFADKNAGTGKTVNVSGVTVSDGNAGGNYAVTHAANTSSSISAAALTLSTSDVSKTYDGTTAANGSAIVTGGQLFGSDSISGGSFAFANKNAGTGKTVNVSGVSINDGHSGGNYVVSYADNTSSSISAAAITLSTSNVSKTYDGTTAANGSAVVTGGQLFSGDTLSGGNFAFADRHAGSGKTVSVSGVTLNDGNAGGNYVVSYSDNTGSTINAAAITLSSSDVTRGYDGTTAANGSAVVTAGQLFGSDSLSGGNFSFANKNAGTGKTVIVSGVTVNDGHSGSNYNVTYAANTSSTISAAALTLSSTDVSKTYDGTTAANGSAIVTAGQLFGSDSLSGGSFAFANRNAGSGKTVNLSGVTLNDGNNGGNYAVTYAANTNSSINAAAITVSTSDVTRSYDGTTAANGNAVVTSGQLFGGDSLSGGNYAFTNRHAGTGKTVTVGGVTVNDGHSGGNYTVTYADNTSSTINAAAITLSSSNVSRTYDGTTAANGSAVVTGGQLFGSDSISGGSFSFANKNAGSNKTVNVSGVTLSDGNNGGNYAVTYVANTSSTISAAALTLSTNDVSKTYDGTTTANGSAIITAGQLFGSDSLSGGSFSFADRNAGSNKTVNVSGVTLNDGNSGGNYAVTYVANTHSTVTPKLLSIGTGPTVAGKVYDGTVAATVTGWGSVDTGIAGETLTLTGTGAQFTTADAGTQKAATVTGYVLGNATGSASNYTLASTSATAHADISKAVLTIVANNDAKFVSMADGAGYNGVSYTGFVNGETSAVLGGSANVVRSNPGMQAAGSYTGVLSADVSGLSSTNYSFATRTGSFTIVPSNQLLVRTANVGSTYGDTVAYTITSAAYFDGSSVHNLPVSAGSTPGTFTVTDGASGSATFALTPTGAGRSGAGHVNVGAWQLGANNVQTVNAQNFSNTLTVVGAQTVDPKALTAQLVAGVSKVYDGTNTMTDVQIGLAGSLAGDALSATNGSGAFSGHNAGTGLGYTVNGVTIGGADAGNYRLTGGSSFSGNNGAITPRTLVVEFGGVNRVYDGSTSASFTSTDNRIAGDVFSVQGQAQFADKNVGSAKTVTIDNLALSGASAGNYVLASPSGQTQAEVTRLATVTWVGGTSGNWFDPANWAGGAVPDLANVAQVILPSGVTVSFDTTGAVSPADASGPVQIDSLGSAGSLQMHNGTLNVGTGGMALAGFEQTGGSATIAGNATVSGSFSQGSQGSLAVGGNLQITDTQGGVQLGQLQVQGTLGVASTGGAITQAASTALTVAGTTTLDAGSAAITLTNPGNDFQGSVSARGGDVRLADDHGGLMLGDVTAGTLTATSSGGNLSQQTGTVVTVGGLATLSAPGALVDLPIRGNTYGQLDTPGSDYANQVMGTSLVRPALPPQPESVRMPLPEESPPLLAAAPATLADAAPALLVTTSPNSRGPAVAVTRLTLDGQPDEVTITVDRDSLLRGFNVTLPESLAWDGDASARRESGRALPEWLVFDAAKRSFSATAVPPRRLPLRLSLTLGGRKVIVVLQAASAR